MKTVTSFFVYAGLIVLITSLFFLVPLDWSLYIPIILLIGFIIFSKRKKTKKEAANLRCKECNALLGGKFLENDARQICPFCGTEDAID